MELRDLPDPGSEADGQDAGSTGAAALSAAEALVQEGRRLEAIALLADANRREADGALERRLVELRHDVVATLDSPGRQPWPPTFVDPFPDAVGRLPEIPAADLEAEVLGAAVAHHGALVVRGLFDQAQVARTLETIRLVEAAREQWSSTGVDDRWYRPVPTASGMDPFLRESIAGQGGIWLADSPAGTARVLDDLESSGAVAAIAGHFGERPLFSLQKSTLRRSAPVHDFAGWHQDGSFLGPLARAMNVWVAVSRCGGPHLTPGLELVPRRIAEILPTDGGLGPASIADASVARVAGDTPPICPEFAPGDAALFDERFLHRTHLFPGMTHDRFALECWFFAPSFAAEKYVSFVA